MKAENGLIIKKNFFNNNGSNSNNSGISFAVILLVSVSISLVFLPMEKAWAQTVIATVDVGNGPDALEYNPSNGNVYVANFNSQDVSVIDSNTNTVTATVDVGGTPEALEYNPSNEDVYVANFAFLSGDVSVIDSSTNTVIANVDVGLVPIALEYNPSNGNIYVANTHSDDVSVIDSDTNTVIAIVQVGLGPGSLLYNPSNGNIYVANGESNNVYVIDSDTNNVIATVDVGESPQALEYNPSNGNIYVANTHSDDVYVIDSDTNNVIATVDVGESPQALEYNPSNGNIYVANFVSGNVSVIDSSTNNVIATVDVGGTPKALEYNPSNEDVYVVNFDFGSGDVSVIDSDTNTVISIVQVGLGPGSLLYNPSNGNIYVTNAGSNTVSVISSNNILIQPPTATTITSSVDGNGNQIQNESSTVSPSITFEVTATQGTNTIAGFECSLDNSPFSNCATSEPATISYDSLASGEEHTFKVRAVDTEGNTDPNPATFIWTVLTPEQATEELVDTIDDMELPQGTANSLQGPLNTAIQHLENNNEQAACGSLGAFLNQVDAKENNGQLTPQQAEELRQQATAIQQEIDCSSNAASTSSSNPIESMIDSTLSNIESMQSEQTDNAIETIKKGMNFYNDFIQ